MMKKRDRQCLLSTGFLFPNVSYFIVQKKIKEKKKNCIYYSFRIQRKLRGDKKEIEKAFTNESPLSQFLSLPEGVHETCSDTV